MTLPKVLAVLSIILFTTIGIAALFKERSPKSVAQQASLQPPLEIELDQTIQTVIPAVVSSVPSRSIESFIETTPLSAIDLPDANRIEEFFNKDGKTLPIVETITYKSRVPWLKGRPAWLSDYASYYETSRHFIARSLNGKPDYLKQELAEGDRFNVFRKDKTIQFHLVVDTSRCKMWLYCLDLEEQQKILLKTYSVGLGRIDSSKTSGLLTPLGNYTLGDRIAIYKPKVIGTHHGKKIEMITVFGTRWIPFEKELEGCTAPAKGFGLHGIPWFIDTDGQLKENISSIGKYESDGCIRLSTADMEELFAIIITKPTIIEIVPDFSKAAFYQFK